MPVGAADEPSTATRSRSSQHHRPSAPSAARAAWATGSDRAQPGDLTAANVAAYHAQLVAGGLASSTVKKERAAINSFLRWLVEFDHIPAVQARAALDVMLPAHNRPRASTEGTDRCGAQYDALLQAARAAIADTPLAGARDRS